MPIAEGKPLAQAFTPTTDLLTMVEIMVVKRYNPGDFIVTIRETLDGPDIVSQTFSSEEIHEDLSWKTIDLNDINLTIGQQYYLICSAEDTQDYNKYYWYFGHNQPYVHGEAWIYDSSWNMLEQSGFPGLDLGFKTYGLLNDKPTKPTIEGPSIGRPTVTQYYQISSDDKNNDQLWYEISWSNTDQDLIGPFNAGDSISINHTWSTEGEYTISIKAIDEHDAESELTLLQVSMAKTKKHTLLQHHLLERYVDLFSLIRLILSL